MDKEISPKQLVSLVVGCFKYALIKWRALLPLTIIGGLLGIAYATSTKVVYEAACTFVLEEGAASPGIGQYAGLASMVGIDLGGSVNGLFQGENIIELYKSRSMIQKTLLTEANFDGKKELLIDRYIDRNSLRDEWKKNAKLATLRFDLPTESFTRLHDSIIGVVTNDISRRLLSVEKPDKKLSIIRVTVRSEDELFAKHFTIKIVQNVNDFYVRTKTKKLLYNLNILQKQSDSVRRVLNSSIGGTASAIDAHPNANPALQLLKVPSQLKQVDVQASSAVYAELVKNLEVARISLREATPLIQVIDQPILPLKAERKSNVFFGLLGAALAFLLSVGVLLLKRWWLIAS